MARYVLISESANKKQQATAKLIWGAKGKTLLANFDTLIKLKKKLGEDENSLLSTLTEFLKTELDDKSIAKLKKRKGFDTLPVRLKRVAVQASKLAVLREAHDKGMKGLNAFSTLLGKEAGKMSSTSSTKNQQETAKVVWGAKGKVVVAQYDILLKLKKKLGQAESALVDNLGAFLKASFDQRTIDRLKKRKGFDTLGTRLKAVASKLPKLLDAQTAYNKDLKEVMKFNTLLGNAAGTGVANKVSDTSNKAAQKAANKVLKARKPTPKFTQDDIDGVLSFEYTDEDGKTRTADAIHKTLKKYALVYDDEVIMPGPFKVPYANILSVKQPKKVKKNKALTSGLSDKQRRINQELAQGYTIAQGIGSELGEFMADAMKKAGMKNIESAVDGRDAVQFESKGTAFDVAIKLLKQLKNNTDTSSSILNIEPILNPNQANITTYVDGKQAVISINGLMAKMQIHTAKKVIISSVFTDGSKFFSTPAASNKFNAVTRSLKVGGRPDDAKKQIASDTKFLNNIKEGMSMGMTPANIRKALAKLSKSVMQDLVNELPELGDI